MNIESISIRTKGDAEVQVVLSPNAAALPLPQIVGAAGHTKHFADGSTADGTDPRTDHVAVTDHSTGLMWAVKSIGDKDGDPMSQADCEKACAELRLLGHDEWRLPTRSELAALVDENRHEPAIDTGLLPGVLPRWHWTSTATAWSSSSAWGVHFRGGLVYYFPRFSHGFALAVRRAGQ